MLSDRDSTEHMAPIPSLLLTSAVHHHLIREKTRTRVGLVVEAGDRLHLLVRQEAAIELRELLERWRTGPVGPPVRRRPAPRAAPRPFTLRPWDERDGDPHPHAHGASRPHDPEGRRIRSARILP